MDKIGVHVYHVGTAIYTRLFVDMAYRLLGAAHKVVPISENRRRKSKLYMKLGTRGQWRSMSNKIAGEHLHHVGNAMQCMIKLAFAGHCTQSGTHQ